MRMELTPAQKTFLVVCLWKYRGSPFMLQEIINAIGSVSRQVEGDLRHGNWKWIDPYLHDTEHGQRQDLTRRLEFTNNGRKVAEDIAKNEGSGIPWTNQQRQSMLAFPSTIFGTTDPFASTLRELELLQLQSNGYQITGNLRTEIAAWKSKMTAEEQMDRRSDGATGRATEILRETVNSSHSTITEQELSPIEKTSLVVFYWVSHDGDGTASIKRVGDTIKIFPEFEGAAITTIICQNREQLYEWIGDSSARLTQNGKSLAIRIAKEEGSGLPWTHEQRQHLLGMEKLGVFANNNTSLLGILERLCLIEPYKMEGMSAYKTTENLKIEIAALNRQDEQKRQEIVRKRNGKAVKQGLEMLRAQGQLPEGKPTIQLSLTMPKIPSSEDAKDKPDPPKKAVMYKPNPFKADVFRVIIASPSDMVEERQAAAEAIYDWNDQHASALSVVLLPMRWERNTVPTSGVRPQGEVNRQLVKVSDVLIGMFWTKLGTSTGVAESGTVEEIDQFVDSGRPAMIYLSSRPVDPNKIDMKQFRKLRAFKSKLIHTAIVGDFKSPDELKLKLLNHLTQKVRDLKSLMASR